jgi:hypothetical protein
LQSHINILQSDLNNNKNEIASLQGQLKDMTLARDSLVRQLQARPQRADTPNGMPTDATMGPIGWRDDISSANGSNPSGMILLAIIIRGKNTSASAIQLTDAYIISELTGAKKTLQVSLDPTHLAPISEVNEIPPGAPIELWADFGPGILAPDFLIQWGSFRFHAEYGNIKYDKTFDEDRVKSFLSQFPEAHIGPHITKKTQ